MTENKRFTIFQDRYDTLYIKDKEVFRGNGLRIGNEEDVKYEHILKVVECLNNLHEENQSLKQSDTITDLETQIMHLKEELDYYKAKCGSLEEGYLKLQKQNDKFYEENQQYKQLIKKVLETTPIKHSLAIELKNSVRELYD